jgi:beta-glucosidase
MDLQMPGPVAEADEVLAEAVRTGRVSESWIDEAAGRVLALANSQAALVREKMDFDKNHQLAVQAAIEGSVLLKNEESLLPFDQSVLSIAIIGEDKNLYQGGGSSELTPRDFTACKTVLKKILPAVRVISAEGHKDGARNPLRLLKDAVLKAAACSVAVVFVRPLYRSETESADHKWFGLPSDQEDLIRQVSAVNPNTVVVLQSGSAVDMSAWIDDVHAVIYTGMSGEGGKEAVMKMVFGFEQPSGRLSETFPAFRGLAPDYCCRVDGSDKAIYGERQYIGYRYYDKTGYPLQYPFGYGLGYGKIEASDFEVGGTAIQSGGEIAVSFTVKNTGNRRAVEVFQLYAGKPSGYYDHPEKELAVFQKVRLEPGQTRKISLALKADDLVSYDAYYKEFFLVPGAYRLSLNTDSQTALWTSEVQALSPDYPVRPISEHDELKKFMASEEGRKALKDLIARPEIKEKIPQLKNIEQLLLGGDCPLFRMVALSGGVITPEMTRVAAESVNRERKALAK